MKRKLFFGLAGLAIMAAATTAVIVSFTTTSTESDLLSRNLEALTQNEGVTGNCGISQALRCFGTCPACGIVWEAQGPGPASNMSGSCYCGYQF